MTVIEGKLKNNIKEEYFNDELRNIIKDIKRLYNWTPMGNWYSINDKFKLVAILSYFIVKIWYENIERIINTSNNNILEEIITLIRKNNLLPFERQILYDFDIDRDKYLSFKNKKTLIKEIINYIKHKWERKALKNIIDWLFYITINSGIIYEKHILESKSPPILLHHLSEFITLRYDLLDKKTFLFNSPSVIDNDYFLNKRNKVEVVFNDYYIHKNYNADNCIHSYYNLYKYIYHLYWHKVRTINLNIEDIKEKFDVVLYDDYISNVVVNSESITINNKTNMNKLLVSYIVEMLVSSIFNNNEKDLTDYLSNNLQWIYIILNTLDTIVLEYYSWQLNIANFTDLRNIILKKLKENSIPSNIVSSIDDYLWLICGFKIKKSLFLLKQHKRLLKKEWVLFTLTIPNYFYRILEKDFWNFNKFFKNTKVSIYASDLLTQFAQYFTDIALVAISDNNSLSKVEKKLIDIEWLEKKIKIGESNIIFKYDIAPSWRIDCSDKFTTYWYSAIKNWWVYVRPPLWDRITISENWILYRWLIVSTLSIWKKSKYYLKKLHSNNLYNILLFEWKINKNMDIDINNLKSLKERIENIRNKEKKKLEEVIDYLDSYTKWKVSKDIYRWVNGSVIGYSTLPSLGVADNKKWCLAFDIRTKKYILEYYDNYLWTEELLINTLQKDKIKLDVKNYWWYDKYYDIEDYINRKGIYLAIIKNEKTSKYIDNILYIKDDYDDERFYFKMNIPYFSVLWDNLDEFIYMEEDIHNWISEIILEVFDSMLNTYDSLENNIQWFVKKHNWTILKLGKKERSDWDYNYIIYKVTEIKDVKKFLKQLPSNIEVTPSIIDIKDNKLILKFWTNAIHFIRKEKVIFIDEKDKEKVINSFKHK